MNCALESIITKDCNAILDDPCLRDGKTANSKKFLKNAVNQGDLVMFNSAMETGKKSQAGVRFE